MVLDRRLDRVGRAASALLIIRTQRLALACSYIQNLNDFIRPFGNAVTVRLPVTPLRWQTRTVEAMRAEAKKAIAAGATGVGVSAVKQRGAIVAVETLNTSEVRMTSHDIAG